MPLTKKNQEIFEKARRRHRIVFSPGLSRDQWPECHRQVVQAIETAKTNTYDAYNADKDEIDTKPWKNDAKRQAKKLVEKSIDCVSRNEATWRLACESLVFSRLAAEVACKTCRQRVWRAEIECSLSENNRAASSLRKRQEQRSRCRCPMSSRQNDEGEMMGLNKLFIDRADDLVIHPPSLAEELPQDQKPDRVYGLRQTRKFEEILLKRTTDGGYVEDQLHEQPHSISGEALLFPFLVVEAKAGNASDEWYDIKLQTAFPIYTYIQAQQSVRNATGQKSRWDSGPLVWFFCSRGDDWRLFLAFQREATSLGSQSNLEYETIIAPVWTGCVSTLDGALQLFLIVDFIADWARDVYRASILTELRILTAPSAGDVSTVGSDTFIFSSRSLPPAPTIMTIDEDIIEIPECRNDLQGIFKELDSSFGVVRHVTPIESRFTALFITEDNLQIFLSSMEKNDREFFLNRLADRFFRDQEVLTLTGGDINTIEEAWTGNSRLRTSFNFRETKLLTLLNITYYLSPSWEQIRELCVISVTEGAALAMQKHLKETIPLAILFKIPTINFNSVIDSVSRLKTLTTQDNLSSCISRACLSLHSSRISKLSSCFEQCDATVWELVNYVYNVQKRGDLEPDLPFLRLSKSTDIPSTPDRSSAFFAKPLTIENQLLWSNSSAILIHGGPHRQSEVTSTLCVYVNEFYEEPPDRSELARIITKTFEDRDVYHTTRDNGTSKLRTWNSHRRVWNLSDTYGVFFSYGGASFTKWLENLRCPPPSRQGSPRGAFDTGRTMYERKYHPWTDPRLSGRQSRAILRRKFLHRIVAAEAMSWARLAQQSILQGNACCRLCGGEVERLCDIPEPPFEVKHDEFAAWLRSLTLTLVEEGNHFVVEPLSEEEQVMQAILRSLRESPPLPEDDGPGSSKAEREKDLCSVCSSHWSGDWENWMDVGLRQAILNGILEDTTAHGLMVTSSQDYCISTPRQSEEPDLDYLSCSDERREQISRKRKHIDDNGQPSSSESKRSIARVDLTGND